MSTKYAAMTRRNAHTATTRSSGGPLVSRGGPGILTVREDKKKDDDDEERGLAGAADELLGSQGG